MFDLWRRADELITTGMEHVHVLQGAFMEMFGPGMGTIDYEAGTVTFWGNGSQRIETTSVESTANMLAHVALNESVGSGRFASAGDRVSSLEVAAVIEEQLDRTFVRHSLGTEALAQGFSGIVMQLGAARDQLGAAADGAPALARVERIAREHLAEARRSIAALRPEQQHAGDVSAPRSHTTPGLEARLRRAVFVARDAHGAGPMAAAEVAVTVQGVSRRLLADVELELLRVAQAAIVNALRHAHASHVRVELSFTPVEGTGVGTLGEAVSETESGVRITIGDDGCGFDSDVVHPGRFGLVGMGERAARVGAALSVLTAPGEGTEVAMMWRPSEAS